MSAVNASQSSAVSARPPTLRHYQTTAIHAVRDQLTRVRSTLVVAATGTGKTVTFAEDARIEVSHGGRVLILVHRDELARQARRKCEVVGLFPDVEKAKHRASTLAKVVLASVQSMRGARLARWARDHFTKIIVDEAHHAAADSYQAILNYFDSAKVVGYTATPLRADGKALGDTFATVASTYDIRQAIAEGNLVPIVARRIVIESVDLSSIAMRAGDFAQDQLAGVMADERALRGVAVPFLELAQDRLAIGFCVDVEHAEKMARIMNYHRPGCARAVSGKTDEDEREYLLEEHARGVFQFLFNCEILVEGYDAPAVSCIAMIRPTKSWARFVQAAGRGLRPSPETGKRDCLILDFTGATKHSLIGPADCLAGAGELADDVRDEINRLIGPAQLEIGAVIEQADELARARRDSLRLNAVVRYHAENVDPFIGAAVTAVLPACDHRWHRDPASPAQLKALDDDGVTLAKLPPGFSRADAWNLLARIRSRTRDGLCSYKAARKLSQAGVRDTTNLSHDRAKELLDKLRDGGWRPKAIAMESEVCSPLLNAAIGAV